MGIISLVPLSSDDSLVRPSFAPISVLCLTSHLRLQPVCVPNKQLSFLTVSHQCCLPTAAQEVTSPCLRRSGYPCVSPALENRTVTPKGPASCWPPATTPAQQTQPFTKQVPDRPITASAYMQRVKTHLNPFHPFSLNICH